MWTYLAKFLAYNALGLKTLYNKSSHGWKLILMHFIDDAYGKNFIFHSNLCLKTSVLHSFPTSYANILQSWKRNFSHISYTSSCWVTILTLSISYLLLRENFKTGIFSKENFNSPITYIANLHKFHMQFLKSASKY